MSGPETLMMNLENAKVVEAWSALVAEGPTKVFLAGTLEVLSATGTDWHTSLVLLRSRGETGARLTVWVVVVALDQWEVSTEVT